MIAIYEFKNKDGNLLVLAGEGRTPRMVKQDVNGRYYINRWDTVAFKHGLYGGKEIRVFKTDEFKPVQYQRLGAKDFENELEFAGKYQTLKPFGGVEYRILSPEEINIPALLADERKSIDAQAEHWSNS